MVETNQGERKLVWRSDENSLWRLYANTQRDLPPRLTPEELEKIAEKKKEKDAANPFYMAKERKEVKGALIHTPKGYGIIQNFKPESNIISIRVNGVIEDFPREEVSNEVPVTLLFVTKGTKREEVALFPVQFTAKDIQQKIEEDQSQEESSNCQVFWKGRELPKTNDNLEKLGITPLCKLIVLSSAGKSYSLNRFKEKYSGWGYSRGSVDGITFTASKNIRLSGFGIYLPERGTITGTAILSEGDSCQEGGLFTTEVSLTKDDEEEPESKIYHLKFPKPFRIRAGEKYTCTVMLYGTNTYYGSNGNAQVTGDGDVVFDFMDASGSENGTSIDSGQVPTLYYIL